MPKKTKFDGRICNLVPSKGTDKDWTYEDAVASTALGAPAAIPTSKDLRQPTWWKINDQGNTGSCVGWATADGVVRWHMVGRIQRNKARSVAGWAYAAHSVDSVRLIDVSPLYRPREAAPEKVEEKPAPPWLAEIASAVSASDPSQDGSLTTLEDVRKKYPGSKAGDPYEAVWKRFFPDDRTK